MRKSGKRGRGQGQGGKGEKGLGSTEKEKARGDLEATLTEGRNALAV